MKEKARRAGRGEKRKGERRCASAGPGKKKKKKNDRPKEKEKEVAISYPPPFFLLSRGEQKTRSIILHQLHKREKKKMEVPFILFHSRKEFRLLLPRARERKRVFSSPSEWGIKKKGIPNLPSGKEIGKEILPPSPFSGREKVWITLLLSSKKGGKKEGRIPGSFQLYEGGEKKKKVKGVPPSMKREGGRGKKGGRFVCGGPKEDEGKRL